MNQRFSTDDRRRSGEGRPDGDQGQSGYAEQRGKQFDPLGWGEANPASPNAADSDEARLDSGGPQDHSSQRHVASDRSEGRERTLHDDGGAGSGHADASPNQGHGQGRESFGEPPQRGTGPNVGMGDGNSLSSAATAPLQGFRGEGPKCVQRSDERLQEDIRDRLMDAGAIDASDIKVQCNDGVITLEGTVSEPRWKHRIEDLVGQCHGVSEIENRITIKRGGDTERNGGGDHGAANADFGASPGQKETP